MAASFSASESVIIFGGIPFILCKESLTSSFALLRTDYFHLK